MWRWLVQEFEGGREPSDVDSDDDCEPGAAHARPAGGGGGELEGADEGAGRWGGGVPARGDGGPMNRRYQPWNPHGPLRPWTPGPAPRDQSWLAGQRGGPAPRQTCAATQGRSPAPPPRGREVGRLPQSYLKAIARARAQGLPIRSDTPPYPRAAAAADAAAAPAEPPTDAASTASPRMSTKRASAPTGSSVAK